jgi:hypothetical protein
VQNFIQDLGYTSGIESICTRISNLCIQCSFSHQISNQTTTALSIKKHLPVRRPPLRSCGREGQDALQRRLHAIARLMKKRWKDVSKEVQLCYAATKFVNSIEHSVWSDDDYFKATIVYYVKITKIRTSLISKNGDFEN